MKAVPLSGFALSLLILLPGSQAQVDDKTFPVTRDHLCVTAGELKNGPGDSLQVDAETMRAYVHAWTSQRIESKFVYLGPTKEVARFGSGAIRLQFGLSLENDNPCNVIYAMWRIEPESDVVVSVKRNSGQTKSSECTNNGYRNIRPRKTAAVPKLNEGDTHTLKAELTGEELRVSVDETEVWEGSVYPEAKGLSGAVGVRSDNVRLNFDVKAGAYAGVHPNYLTACRERGNASE